LAQQEDYASDQQKAENGSRYDPFTDPKKV
jgi:hypothetical protein